MKRTYQPSRRARARTHGFLVRMRPSNWSRGHQRPPCQGPQRLAVAGPLRVSDRSPVCTAGSGGRLHAAWLKTVARNSGHHWPVETVARTTHFALHRLGRWALFRAHPLGYRVCCLFQRRPGCLAGCHGAQTLGARAVARNAIKRQIYAVAAALEPAAAPGCPCGAPAHHV